MTFFTNGRKAFFSHALDNVVSGNTPAPKGHYVIDLFDRSQGRKDAIQEESTASTPTRFNPSSYIPTDQSTGGIKATAAYAGRLWYVCSPGETGGDSQSPHVGTFVLFSKLVDNEGDIGKCYQEADPTAEDISDLIDTDGGYIQIPDAVNMKALIPYKSMFYVPEQPNGLRYLRWVGECTHRRNRKKPRPEKCLKMRRVPTISCTLEDPAAGPGAFQGAAGLCWVARLID